jgi:hypothetical protein
MNLIFCHKKQQHFYSKVIYIVRNPKNMIISGLVFGNTLTVTKEKLTLDEAFNGFLAGEMLYGNTILVCLCNIDIK